jgi:hypothetical protein
MARSAGQEVVESDSSISLHEIDARQKIQETRAGISSVRCVWKDFFQRFQRKIRVLIVVLPCMLTITQLLLQQNAHFYY